MPPKPPRTGYTPVHAPPWQALTRYHSQATEAPRTPQGPRGCSVIGQGPGKPLRAAYGVDAHVLATGTMLPMSAKRFAYADSGRDTRRNRESLRVAPPWQGQAWAGLGFVEGSTGGMRSARRGLACALLGSCWVQNPRKAKARSLSWPKCLIFGSLAWTRTTDLMINSHSQGPWD